MVSVLRYLLAAAFFVLLTTFLYFRYPFDGMVLSDSWYWYLYDKGDFRWPQGIREDGDWRPQPYSFDWSALASRRGLMPVMVMLIDHLVVGDKRVFLNVLCLLVQAGNFALFGFIVWQLAGVHRLYPILLLATLYPFAASGHFWQHLVLNNLAVTFFLASLLLFLRVLLAGPGTRRGARAVAFTASLCCYWTSILIVDYAIFMSPLFLYLALYFGNVGEAFVQFKRVAMPQTGLALAYIGLTVLAVVLFSKNAPTVFAFSVQFEAFASILDLPVGVIAAAMTTGHAVMLYLSALWFNSVGLILQPAVLVWQNAAVLLESAWILPSFLAIAACATSLWFLNTQAETGTPSPPPHSGMTGFLLVFGFIWTLLAYLPFAAALGYPRLVGLTADRVNLLALWGIAIVIGTLVHRLFTAHCYGTIARTSAFAVGLFLISALLVGNLYLQKEYYVEAYQKERQLALLILERRLAPIHNDRKPIVLLDRAQKVVYPKEQLMAVASAPEARWQALELLQFLINRYFLQEYVSSSYHLNGIMMFGCCPGAAPATIAGYAKLNGLEYLPVYTIDKTFRFEEDAMHYRLGYEQTHVLSRLRGGITWTVFPKRDFELQVIELGESFFQLRGGLVYSTRATMELS